MHRYLPLIFRFFVKSLKLMKVLHVIPSVSPVRGGPSKAIMEMVQALINQGMETEIATTNDSGLDLLTVSLGQKVDYHGVPVWFFPRFSPPINSIREFAFSSALTQWLWRSIPHYDLIQVHAIFSYPSTIAMTIARHYNIPYIARPLGQLCHWALAQSKTKKQLYLNLIERKNLNQAKVLHFTASLEQEEVRALNLHSPSVVIPLGLSLPKITKAIDSNPKPPYTLLFLSRLHLKKGIDNLLAAWERINPHNWQLIIAGSGEEDYVKAIRFHIETLGVGRTVQLVGAIEGEAKWNLYRISDLFVLPTFSENFGIVVAEALAAGLPVITTKAAPWSDLVTHQCGWWIDVGVDPLVETLNKAMALSPGERQAMGQRGRQLIEQNYTWEQTARKLMDVYEAILNDRPIPYGL